eukprot:m.304766 g.304766  ORF g.304766 m.304766 type:complete len:517 (+) comp16339_c0_seq20:7851-9401(+)
MASSVPEPTGIGCTSLETELIFIRQIPPDFTATDLRAFFGLEVNGRQGVRHGHHDCPTERCDGHLNRDKSVSSQASIWVHHPSHGLPSSSVAIVQHIRRPPFVKFHFKQRVDLESREEPKSLCAIAEVYKDETDRLIMEYNKVRWFNKIGRESKQTILITRAPSGAHETLRHYPELQPPAVLPHGNVGTPDADLFEAIRTCRLPTSLIRSLGLNRPFASSRAVPHYHHVPFNYDGIQRSSALPPTSTHELRQLKHDLRARAANAEAKESKRQAAATADAASVAGNVESDEEEWDRAERYAADGEGVDGNQGRAKERLYEGDVAQPWEKGGSGLVFYTDSTRWDATEGDEDEKWADEWDVDTEGYEKLGGFVAEDIHTVSDLRDKGLLHWMHRGRHHEPEKTVKGDAHTFSCDGLQPPSDHTLKRKRPTGPPCIGAFEAHTRGFGSKIMRSQGWSAGEPLGGAARQSAIVVPVSVGTAHRPHQRRSGIGMTPAAAAATGPAVLKRTHAQQDTVRDAN